MRLPRANTTPQAGCASHEPQAARELRVRHDSRVAFWRKGDKNSRCRALTRPRARLTSLRLQSEQVSSKETCPMTTTLGSVHPVVRSPLDSELEIARRLQAAGIGD